MDSVIGYKLLKVLKLDEVYGLLTDEETLNALEEVQLQPSKNEQSKLNKLCLKLTVDHTPVKND